MRYPLSKSSSASPETIAARWKITSGRCATNFSAAPGTAKSQVTVSIGKSGFGGCAGATTSCSVIAVMSALPRRPSRINRSESLRPTIPAAPNTRICKTRLLVVIDFRLRVARSLFHRSGHGRHVVLYKERIEDHERQRTTESTRHQRSPTVDVAVDEFVDDSDRHRLVLGRLQKRQCVDELVPAQRETEDEGGDQAGNSQRQHDLDQDLPAAGAVYQRAFLQLVRNGLEVSHQQPCRKWDKNCRIAQDQRHRRVEKAVLKHDRCERNEQN